MSCDGWTLTSVANITNINVESYSVNESWEYVNYLDTGNITRNRIDKIERITLGSDKLPSRARRKVKSGDIVYSTVRPNQQHYGIIKKPVDNMLVSTGFAVIKTKEELASNYFLYWYLSQQHITDYLHAVAENSTSAYPSIKPSDISKLKLWLPLLPEQRAIARILSSLDDKIELNNRMNKTLEEIAQTLFKRWFVDFEFPDENGNPYKSSGGKMVDSELGMIPEGWETIAIKDISRITIGGDWGKESQEDDLIPVICLRGTDLQSIKSTGYSNTAPTRWIKKSSLLKRKLSNLDVLIGGSGLGPIGRSIYFDYSLNELFSYPIIYSNFCKRIRFSSSSLAMYTEHVFSNMYGNGLLRKFFTGTSIPNLDINNLVLTRILLPQQNILDSFTNLKGIINERKFSKENIVLSQIRDTLLPKLMSGEIRVPITEE